MSAFHFLLNFKREEGKKRERLVREGLYNLYMFYNINFVDKWLKIAVICKFLRYKRQQFEMYSVRN